MPSSLLPITSGTTSNIQVWLGDSSLEHIHDFLMPTRENTNCFTGHRSPVFVQPRPVSSSITPAPTLLPWIPFTASPLHPQALHWSCCLMSSHRSHFCLCFLPHPVECENPSHPFIGHSKQVMARAPCTFSPKLPLSEPVFTRLQMSMSSRDSIDGTCVMQIIPPSLLTLPLHQGNNVNYICVSSGNT